MPFTSKMGKFFDNFSKIDPLYCSTDAFLRYSKFDKIALPQDGEEVKLDEDEGFNFITECFFITHALVKLSFKQAVRYYDTIKQKLLLAAIANKRDQYLEILKFQTCLDVHLCAKRLRRSLLHFLSFSSVYFCFTNSPDEVYDDDLTPEEYMDHLEIGDDGTLHGNTWHLPEYFSQNISKVGMFYLIFKHEVFDDSFYSTCLLGF